MASHGKKRHTKRLAAPSALQILRKQHVWSKTSAPGGHAKRDALPLVVLLRDVLHICNSSAEARELLNQGNVTVDGRIITDPGFPTGLMDIVSIKNGNSFIVINKKGKLVAVKSASTYKLCKVTGKHVISRGKTQLSLHDGRTLIVPDAKKYSTGDTLKLSIPDAKVLLDHLKLEKGSRCYVFHGRHAGAIGSLVDIHVFPGITPSNVRITDENGKEVVTLKDYVFVVDKEFKV